MQNISFLTFRFLKLLPLLVVLNCSAILPAIGEELKSSQSYYPMDFSFTTIEGDIFSLKDHRGSAILVVNTASQCGFKKQFADMQTLWESYNDKGLIVIAVPSNDFGSQEPFQGADLKKFCEMNYKTTFPIMEKVKVKGKDAHPFYQYVQQHYGFTGSPKWNFHKYLISPEGELVDWFSSLTSPTSTKFISAVQQVLPVTKTAKNN